MYPSINTTTPTPTAEASGGGGFWDFAGKLVSSAGDYLSTKLNTETSAKMATSPNANPVAVNNQPVGGPLSSIDPKTIVLASVAVGVGLLALAFFASRK